MESPRGKFFPIVEALGHAASPQKPFTQEEVGLHTKAHCPFGNMNCEKMAQYGQDFGYCSVRYASEWDDREMHVYAVCDHRLDGEPIWKAVEDYFGSRDNIQVVPEIVMGSPRVSYDWVAVRRDDRGAIDDVVLVEAQAIDIRGGGVSPMYAAWREGEPEKWLDYYNAWARENKPDQEDRVDYGVNLGNIYKRFGLQLATKAAFASQVGSKLYAVMQHKVYEYLERRVPFQEVAEDEAWDLTFVTFDYDGAVPPDQQVFVTVAEPDTTLSFTYRRTIRTTIESYATALAAGDSEFDAELRKKFLVKVVKKAGLEALPRGVPSLPLPVQDVDGGALEDSTDF